MGDIEDIKQRKREELIEEESETDSESEKRAFLTEDARYRLNSFKMANPELGEEIEEILLQMNESGRIGGSKITEEEMKQILYKYKDDNSVDYDIKRR